MKPIVLKGHERSITQVKYNREGDLLFTCSKAEFPCVWYSDTGERLGTYNGHKGSVTSCDVNFDTTRLITGSGDATVKIWDVETGAIVHNLPVNVPARIVEFAEGDRQFLVLTDNVMSKPSTLWVYSINDMGRPSGNPRELPIKDVKITHAMWGPMNKTILTSGQDGVIRVYDSDTLTLVQESKEHSKSINKMSFDKDKFTFVTASFDSTAKLFDTKTLKPLKNYDTGRPVNAASISPIKEHVIIGGGQSAESVTTGRMDSSQFKVRFFHKIFQEELGSIPGHFGPVETLAFSPDGRSFVSGGWDGYVRVHHFDPSYFTAEESILTQ
jgi:translation initiation factor 3 subunit I